MSLRRAVAQRRGPTRARAFVVAASLAAGPGCSYGFVHGPRATAIAGPEGADAEWIARTCTSSNAAPIVDTVLGTTLGAMGGLVLVAGVGSAAQSKPTVASSFSWPPLTAGQSAALIGTGAAVAAVGGVLLGSAVTGFGRTADCRQAIERSVPRRLPPQRP